MMLANAVENIIEHGWMFLVSYAGLFVLAKMRKEKGRKITIDKTE